MSVQHTCSWQDSDLLRVKQTLISGVGENQANVNRVLRNKAGQLWMSKGFSLHIPQTWEAYHAGTVQRMQNIILPTSPPRPSKQQASSKQNYPPMNL